jgi:putative oxidoreductase
MGPNAPVPGLLQAAAAVAEFGGGLALIVGLLTPLAALGQLVTMGVALVTVLLPQHIPFVGDPGKPSYEIALVYFAAALLFVLVGPGTLSLDALLFNTKAKRSAESPVTSTNAVAPAH